jgi:ABC-type sugar transport system substrate-binding protein/Flp pilus assembly protein TadD
MASHIEFINRTRELAQIRRALLGPQTQALYFHADGGVGKTRLLQEAHATVRGPDYQTLLDIPADKEISIAVVNEFCQTAWGKAFMQGVTETVANMGIEMESYDARFSVKQMAKDIEDVIKKAPNVLIVRLGNEELRTPIQRALEQGIRVLLLDNFLELEHRSITRVVTQEAAATMKLAEQLVLDIGRQGKVVALEGDTHLSRQRVRRLEQFLTGYPDVDLETEVLRMGEGMAGEVSNLVQSLLREESLQALWVTWDEFTPTVLQTLRGSGRADVRVYSFDLLNRESIQQEPLDPDDIWRASIVLDPVVVGQSVVHLAALAACDRPIHRHYDIPAQVLNETTRFRVLAAPARLNRIDPPYLPNLVALDIIDFDDQTYHNELVFAFKLAGMIGEEYFTDFYEELRDYTELKKEGVSGQVYNRHKLRAERAFKMCLEKLSRQQRTILILDTLEKAPQILPFIAETLAAIPNVVALMAGRSNPQKLETLEAILRTRLESSPLSPLGKEASREYIERKQVRLHIILDNKQKERLLDLAQGKPILLDLAVEWQARGRRLSWLLNETSVEEPFEAQLVRHIGEVRDLLDWVTLLLAYIYPLDRAAISEFLELTPQEAQHAWEEVQDLVFIKHLPGERLTLHDEMRDLVNRYVWEDFDPDGSRRQELSEFAVYYLAARIEGYQEYIAQLRGDEDARQTWTTQPALDSWREVREIEEVVWQLREQRLLHQLRVDLHEGFESFRKLYKDATEDYRYALRLDWIERVEQYYSELDSLEQCDLLLSKAKALLDNGKYVEAANILRGILKRTVVRPDQRVDTHIQLANVVIRQGDLENGVRHFEQAVKHSKDAEPKRWQVKAINGLGWAHRLMADLDQARLYYEEALNLALELEKSGGEDTRREQALLYNNLGFLYAYKRTDPNWLERAQRLCLESLELAQALNEERGVGRAYSALGCVCFMGGEIEKALENFELALEVFEPKGDEEWLCQVYAWRGAARMSGSNKDYDAAKSDFERARKYRIDKEQPIILSRLALIYLIEGRLDEAKALVEECREIADRLPDPRYQWIAIRDLARVARYRRDCTRDTVAELEGLMNQHLLQQLQRKLNTEQTTFQEQQLPVNLDQLRSQLERWGLELTNLNVDQRAHGMLRLELGCLAMGLPDHEKAVEYFIGGMKLLIEVGQYGGDQSTTFLLRIEEQFFHDNPRISDIRIRDLGRDLLMRWRSELLHVLYPDIRNVYERWTNW